MADNGWWSRNLGGQQSAPQRPVGPPQQYQPPMHQVPPQYPQGAPQQPQYPQQPQQQFNPSQIKVTGQNLYEAAQYWQGGEATRTETNPCPRCGSPHFFSRAKNVSRGPAPAPTCYTCGFNGMFEQGDPAVWQG